MAVQSSSRGPLWTQEALARYVQLDGRLEFVADDRRDRIVELLGRARELLEHPRPASLFARLSNWWTGDRIERTWVWLQEAEVEIVASSNADGRALALRIARQRAERALPKDDERRKALEAPVVTAKSHEKEKPHS